MEDTLKSDDQLLIDDLLDTYNDYRTLYELFKDEEYLDVTRACLVVIRNLSKKKVKVKAQAV